MSNKLVLLLILLLFLLLSGLMLFDNSGHQLVVLGIVDSFFSYFICNTFHYILVAPRKQIQSSSPSLISVSISQSFVLFFSNAPIATGISYFNSV